MQSMRIEVLHIAFDITREHLLGKVSPPFKLHLHIVIIHGKGSVNAPFIDIAMESGIAIFIIFEDKPVKIYVKVAIHFPAFQNSIDADACRQCPEIFLIKKRTKIKRIDIDVSEQETTACN